MGAKRIDPTSFDVDKFVAQFEKERDARLAAAGMPRNLDRSGSRDLTDEELRTLNKAYVEGLEKLKAHQWSSKAPK